MKNLYHLTEEDVQLDMLTPQEAASFSAQKNQMYDKLFEQRIDALKPVQKYKNELLDKYAVQCGFQDYHEVTSGRWGREAGNPEVKQAIEKFDRLHESDEFHQAQQRIDDVHREYDDKLQAFDQAHLYRIFCMTRPRIDAMDMGRHPIKSPAEWLVDLHNEYQQALKDLDGGAAYPEQWLYERICRSHDYTDGYVDYGLNAMAGELTRSDYQVHALHSGMVCDHPYDRWLTDDLIRGIRAGEHRSWGSEPPATRVAIVDKGYDLERLSQIAEGAGMQLSRSRMQGVDVITFRFPAMRDGTSFDDFQKEVDGLTAGLDKMGDKAEYSRRYILAASNHGGFALYSDDMIRNRVSRLVTNLMYRAQELQTDKNVDYSKDVVIDKVDMKALFNKYISLFEHNFGKERAEAERRRILEGVDGRSVAAMTEGQPYRVLLDTRDGTVDVVDDERKAAQVMQNDMVVDVASRLSAINVYRSVGADQSHRIRCRIDGEPQMSVQLSPAQERYWQGALMHELKEVAKLRLAAECFSDKLCAVVLDRQRDRGMKR